MRGCFPGHSRWASLDGVLYVPLSEHDGNLATVPQPAHLGRVRGFDVRYGFRAFLVCRFDSGPGDAARPRDEQSSADYLRHAGDGLARFGASLAPLSIGVSIARGPCTAPGALGSHGRELRFRGGHRSRMAYNDLSTLLRCRCDLLRLRDGFDDCDPAAESLRS